MTSTLFRETIMNARREKYFYVVHVFPEEKLVESNDSLLPNNHFVGVSKCGIVMGGMGDGQVGTRGTPSTKKTMFASTQNLSLCLGLHKPWPWPGGGRQLGHRGCGVAMWPLHP